MMAGDSMKEMFDGVRSGGRQKKLGTVDKKSMLPFETLLIPASTEMTLESFPATWPFQCKYVIFPMRVSLGTNNDARLSWRHEAFLNGEAYTHLFNEKTADLIQPNPLRGKWIEVGEKICIRVYNETLSGEPLEVRGAIFGICEVPEKPFAFPSKEERQRLMQDLRRGEK